MKKSVGIYKFTFKKVTIEIIVNNWLINMLAVYALSPFRLGSLNPLVKNKGVTLEQTSHPNPNPSVKNKGITLE